MPPSMARVAPDMLRAISEARKTQEPAISSGLQARRRGGGRLAEEWIMGKFGSV